MSYTFEQVLNKLPNGKIFARPSWPNGQYIVVLPNIDSIFYIYPSNPLNPCTFYMANQADCNATDWVELN